MDSEFARFKSCGVLPVGHLKALVLVSPADYEEEFHHRIVAASETIHNCFGFFQWTQSSVMRRVEECIEYQGRNFDHLL
jgi:hypothetical protein